MSLIERLNRPWDRKCVQVECLFQRTPQAFGDVSPPERHVTFIQDSIDGVCVQPLTKQFMVDQGQGVGLSVTTAQVETNLLLLLNSTHGQSTHCRWMGQQVGDVIGNMEKVKAVVYSS